MALSDARLLRVLKRKYRRMKPTDPNRTAVAHVIADDGARAKLLASLGKRIKAGSLASPGAHPILEQLIQWFEENWLTILEEILKLFVH